MEKETFNEAERFLLGNWAGSRQLEVSMEEVRAKYSTVAQRVFKALQDSQENLDFSFVRVTRLSGIGWLALGRKAWHPDGHRPTGYWIKNLRLEYLSDETKPQPSASIWIKPALKEGIDFNDACKAIHDAAPKILSEDEYRRCELISDGETVLKLEIQPGRKELLEMLSQKDSQAFVDCLVSHFEILAKFTDVLDSVLVKTKK